MSGVVNGMRETLVTIARKAGDAIMNVYGTEDFAVESKDDDSPLTAADRAAHECIANELARAYPDIPILSEEGGDIPFDERSSWSHYFLVDPLDGTKEFIKRNGEFTVNIAFIEGHRAVTSVVHAPALGRTYSADETGAWRQDGPREPLAIRVAGPVEGRAWRLVASRSHMTDEVQALAEALGEVELVSMGSSLKLCLVAEGAADLYPRLGPTCEWDTAAAQCVVERAGGEVVTPELAPLAYNEKDELLNPWFIVCSRQDPAWTGPLQRIVG